MRRKRVGTHVAKRTKHTPFRKKSTFPLSRLIFLAFLVGVLILGIIAVRTPQILFGKAAPPSTITVIPTPTTHKLVPGFTYLPKLGYSVQPKNCVTTGCAQPANGCFISCRDGVFGCKEYLKKDNINTNYDNGRYLCQNYWILPSSVPTRTPTPTPTRFPTPTPNSNELTIIKYQKWFRKIFHLDQNSSAGEIWMKLMASGAILDLNNDQTNELHDMFNQDIVDQKLQTIIFSVKNDQKPINDFYVALFPPNKNDRNSLIYYYERNFSSTEPKTFENWFKNNNLFAWKFDGYGYPPSYAWPRIFGVDKTKSFVYHIPDLDDYKLTKLGDGYPVDGEKLEVYRFDPIRSGKENDVTTGQIKNVVQTIKFSDHNNKIFLQMPTSSSPVILMEIYKENNGDIIFRGIYFSELS